MKNHKIREIIKQIEPMDRDVADETFVRFDHLSKPLKSLGRLEEIIAQAAGIYGRLNPAIDRKVIFLMAADHGVCVEGVSAYPSEITQKMVSNFLQGGAAINVLARHFGIEVIIVDMGIKGSTVISQGLMMKKIAQGTRNMAEESAMTQEMAEESILNGYRSFEEAYKKKKINLIGLGEMGIGNTTASSAIISLLTRTAVEKVVDQGTGIRLDQVKHKIEIIKKAIMVNTPDENDPVDILAKVGGFEIGGLVGCILGAASRRIPIVMDGLISGASSLLAVKIAPTISEYLFASHCSKERGHKIVLSYLNKKPMFDLEMHLGEGTGAAFGINVIEAGFKLLNQMADLKDLK